MPAGRATSSATPASRPAAKAPPPSTTGWRRPARFASSPTSSPAPPVCGRPGGCIPASRLRRRRSCTAAGPGMSRPSTPGAPIANSGMPALRFALRRRRRTRGRKTGRRRHRLHRKKGRIAGRPDRRAQLSATVPKLIGLGAVSAGWRLSLAALGAKRIHDRL